MIADENYNDFIGTVAATVSNQQNENIHFFAQRLGINMRKYEPLGVTLSYTTEGFYSGSLLLVEKTESTKPLRFNVQLELDEKDLLMLFRSLSIVLKLRNSSSSDTDYFEEINLDSLLGDRNQ
jgi:hypothetical protein